MRLFYSLLIASFLVSCGSGEGDKSSSDKAKVEDNVMSSESQEYMAVLNKQAEIERLIAKARMLYQSGQAQEANQLATHIEELKVKYVEEAQSFALKYAPSSNAIEIAKGFLENPSANKAFLDSFSVAIKESKDPFAEHFRTMYESAKVLAEGGTPPNIELPNKEGKPVSLYSLRGKYVLVDFWATWCGPCRREIPHVVEAYKKYKNKGFEVYGVALERGAQSLPKWKKFTEENQMNWIHVVDLEGVSSGPYQVSGIPMTYLLDPEGKIVAKNLRGAQLEGKLRELLGE